MEDKIKYDPQIHHRRSIRLKGYDYGQAGAYFITICMKDRACLLGHVVDGTMILSEAGKMIDKWWQKVPGKFPGIELDEYQLMPDHFHAIVINVGADPRVRPISTGAENVLADPRVRPISSRAENVLTDPRTRPENAGPDPCVRTISTPAENADNVIVSPDLDKHNIDKDFLPVGLGEHTGSPLLPVNLGDHTTSPLHKIIQWFKTMATNEYIRNVKMNDWEPFNGKLFQRDYYEHIIRNEIAYNNIAAYVKDNPANWDSNNLNAD